MPPFPADTGILSVASPYSVSDTPDRLEGICKSKGNLVFARMDQQREAEKVGLALRPTQFLISGNPAAGTVLMANEAVLEMVQHARGLNVRANRVGDRRQRPCRSTLIAALGLAVPPSRKLALKPK